MSDGGAAVAPAPMSRAQKREQSRSTILSTAIRLFAERGFEGVRLDEIANAAGVRRTLVLYYFPSKEELWQAAGRQVAEAFNRTLHEKALAAREGYPEDPITSSIAASLDAYLEQPDYPRFLVREGGAAGPRLAWLIERFEHVEVNYGSAEMQAMLKDTIVREVVFAILLSMAALGPLMDAWLSRVAGRESSGLYPMSPGSRADLVQVLARFLSSMNPDMPALQANRERQAEAVTSPRP